MSGNGRTVYIAGAGIAGLTLALALAKFGATVVVLERNTHIQEVGAGLQISPNARHVLDRLGVDRALHAVAFEPKGIDVYFENVGGGHLDAVLPRMNQRGRVAVCGMISTYNGGGEGVRNLSTMIYSRIRMEGFVASDFPHLQAAFVSDMTGWLKDGRIKYQETILDGFERAPEGLIGLFSGLNSGKMLIRVSA